MVVGLVVKWSSVFHEFMSDSHPEQTSEQFVLYCLASVYLFGEILWLLASWWGYVDGWPTSDLWVVGGAKCVMVEIKHFEAGVRPL